MGQPVIAVEGLGFDVGPTRSRCTVFTDVSFSCNSGEFVTLTGRSGSGKSSILRMLSALVTPSRGRALCAGIDVTKLSASQKATLRRETVSMIFQDYNLVESLTALDNVSLPLEITGVSRKTAQSQARSALESVGIESLSAALPHLMSGGEQQRVSIARAFVSPGQILLADEPTGAIDEQTGIEIVRLLKLVAEAGKAVLMVTHDTQIAAQADRVLELHNNGIVDRS